MSAGNTLLFVRTRAILFAIDEKHSFCIYEFCFNIICRLDCLLLCIPYFVTIVQYSIKNKLNSEPPSRFFCKFLTFSLCVIHLNSCPFEITSTIIFSILVLMMYNCKVSWTRVLNNHSCHKSVNVIKFVSANFYESVARFIIIAIVAPSL